MKPLRSIFLLIFASTSILATFQQVQPILWLDTGILLSLGNRRQSISIHIPNVCPDLSLPGFQEWCRKKREEYLMKPLENLCKPFFARTSRFKRQSNSSSSTFERETRDELDLLKASVNRLRVEGDRLNTSHHELHGTVRSVAEIQGQINTRITSLENEVRRVEEWRKGVTDIADKLIDISTYFSTISGELEEVRRDWAEGRSRLANPNLFKALTWPDHAQPLDRFESMHINSCYVSREKGYVTFDVNETTIAPELRIFRASPFTLQSIPEGKPGMRIEYTGPSHVIYNSTSHCLLPYGGSPEYNLGLLPPEVCGIPNSNGLFNYWTSTCLPFITNDVSSIQLKSVDDNVYIYCSGHKISLYKKTVTCPAYVFSVHMNESFSFQTEDGTELNTVVFPPEVSYSGALSTKITLLLMPNINKLVPDFSVCAQFLEPSWDAAARRQMKGKQGESQTVLWIALSALVLAVAACALVTFSILRQSKMASPKRRLAESYQLRAVDIN